MTTTSNSKPQSLQVLTQLPPDAMTTSNRINTALAMVEDAVIDGPDMYQYVADQGRNAAQLAKALEEKRLSITRPMDEAKKNVMALFAPAVDAATRVVELSKSKCIAWDREQERIATEARRKADAEAKRLRDEELASARERQRVADAEAAEAERKRQDALRDERDAAAEAQRAIDEGNAAAAKEAEAKRLEAQRQKRDAEAAQQAAAQESADAAEDHRAVELAPAMPALPATAMQVKADGVSRRKSYKFQVNDKRLLILGAAAELCALHPALAKALREFKLDLSPSVLATFLDASEKNIRTHVTRSGDQSNLPGVRVFEEATVVYRG